MKPVKLTDLQIDEIIRGLLIPNVAAVDALVYEADYEKLVHVIAVAVRDARAAKKAAEQQ